MFVPCPRCGFLVAVIVTHDGAVQRCPRCESEIRGPEEATPDSAPAATADDAPASGEAGQASAAPADIIDTAAQAPETARPDRREPRKRATPSFVRTPASPAALRTSWRWYLAIALLGLLLILQSLLAQRRELARDARWRPTVAALCAALRCELPPWHEPTAFTMLQRSVQPKADVPGALSVQASFRNDARWPQAWPTLVLSLSDVDGRQVGLRAFAPDEYRDGHREGDVLAPDQSATVQFDVVEPGPRIVAFTFDFR